MQRPQNCNPPCSSTGIANVQTLIKVVVFFVQNFLNVGGDLVGVNQRDLVTFEVDQDRAIRMAPQMPEGVVRVAESGVRDRSDAAALAEAKAQVSAATQAGAAEVGKLKQELEAAVPEAATAKQLTASTHAVSGTRDELQAARGAADAAERREGEPQSPRPRRTVAGRAADQTAR